MEEIKAQLMDKLGLDEGAAASAVEMVLGFVKDKLPEGSQGLIDSISSGESLGDSAVDAVKGFFS